MLRLVQFVRGRAKRAFDKKIIGAMKVKLGNKAQGEVVAGRDG